MNNSAPTNFGLHEIGQIAVPVTDIERAVSFYRDMLGMRFLFQVPPGLGFFAGVEVAEMRVAGTAGSGATAAVGEGEGTRFERSLERVVDIGFSRKN